MDVTDALVKRFSCRAFTQEQVKREVVLGVLAAATRAPSWGNTQPWEIFVAGGEVLERIRQAYLNNARKGVPHHPDLAAPKREDVPLLKLAILGDYVFLRHYHHGADVQKLPEFVFRHQRNPGCLYNPLYQYFLDRWHDPALPEYELETDELIYRDKAGNEVRREKFELPTLAQV